MNPTMDELTSSPGAYLAKIREQKKYTLEYVSAKLHLRVQMIELLEADNYSKMPEPVFIKGYLRAYARLLEIESEPLLAIFNAQVMEPKTERTLWQIKRESTHVEHLSRWFSIITVIVMISAAVVGWQMGWFTQKSVTALEQITALESKTSSTIKLKDISQVQALLALPSNLTFKKTDDSGENSSN